MDWEQEVRWNRLRRVGEPSPHRALRFYRRAFWLALACNVVLLVVIIALLARSR